LGTHHQKKAFSKNRVQAPTGLSNGERTATTSGLWERKCKALGREGLSRSVESGLQAAADRGNVVAQHVELISKGQRQLELVHGLFDSLQPGSDRLAIFRRGGRQHLALDSHGAVLVAPILLPTPHFFASCEDSFCGSSHRSGNALSERGCADVPAEPPSRPWQGPATG